jgi:hypothetical protein
VRGSVPLALDLEPGDVLGIEIGDVSLTVSMLLLLDNGLLLLAPYPGLVEGPGEDEVEDPTSVPPVLEMLDGMLVGFSPMLDDGDPVVVELVKV